MMFQQAKKMSFSGFQEYFIITDIIYLFIYLLHLQLFTFFLFLYFDCTVISVISPLLLLIFYCILYCLWG